MSRRARGFTLIELMVTVAIVAILASAVLPLAELSVKRVKEQQLQEALRQIRLGIDAYKHAAEEGRIEKKPTESGYPQTLRRLVDGVVDSKSSDKSAKLYFLRRIPRDPFAIDPAVPADRTWGLRSYASGPDDPREGDDVYDIYSRSEAVGLNGIRYREW